MQQFGHQSTSGSARTDQQTFPVPTILELGDYLEHRGLVEPNSMIDMIDHAPLLSGVQEARSVFSLHVHAFDPINDKH